MAFPTSTSFEPGSPAYWQRFWNIMAAPWPIEHIYVREGGGGARLMYIDERLALERLNFAAGPGNWNRDFDVLAWRTMITKTHTMVAHEVPVINDQGVKLTMINQYGKSVDQTIWQLFPEEKTIIEKLPTMAKCTITILGVTRVGVGDESNIDEEKGIASDAFKRATVACGCIFLYFAAMLINRHLRRSDLKQKLTNAEIKTNLPKIGPLYYDFLTRLDDVATNFHLNSPWELTDEAMEGVVMEVEEPQEEAVPQRQLAPAI